MRKPALFPDLDEAKRIADVYAARARTVPAQQDSLLEPGNLLMVQERGRLFLRELVRHRATPLRDKQILEVGCGSGAWLRDLIHWGAEPERVFGVDLLPHSIARARSRLPAGVTLEVANAEQLPFDDARFDLVLQSTVFSSILDRQVRQKVAAEMLRVLSPGGLIVWYDARFDNPRNASFAGVSRREIAALFPRCRLRLTSLTLAPPIARWLAPRCPGAYYALGALPFLRTHWLGFIQPRADRAAA
jgi:SAM-dependent methyltransferase